MKIKKIVRKTKKAGKQKKYCIEIFIKKYNTDEQKKKMVTESPINLFKDQIVCINFIGENRERQKI